MKKIKKRFSAKQLQGALIVVVVAALGVYLLTNSHAASPYIASEAESGTLNGSAALASDSNASGGSYAKFGSSSGGGNCSTNQPPTAVADYPSPVALPTIATRNFAWPAPRCFWPNASNTGVPAGTNLKPSGSITITTANTVIDGLLVDGQISINAPGVIIKNTKVVDTTGSQYPIVIDYNNGTANSAPPIIVDTEVDGNNDTNCEGTIEYDHFFALRDNLHNCGDGTHNNGNTVVQDSYIHDLTGSSSAHHDGIQLTQGSNSYIIHNFVENSNGETSCIQVGADQGAISNAVIEDNLVNGAGYSIYGGARGGNSVTNIKIVNNRVMRKPESGAYYTTGGYWGPEWATGDSQITWSDNIWDDTGAVIPDYQN